MKLLEYVTPNSLTLVRILLAPVVFLLIINHKYTLALVFYIIAALTDALDGFIARKNNKTSEMGNFYDALADRILAIATIAALFVTNNLTLFMQIAFALWVLGETVVGIILTLKTRKFYLMKQHRNPAKITAVFLFITICAILVGIPLVYIDVLVSLVILIGAYSFFDYLVFGSKQSAKA